MTDTNKFNKDSDTRVFKRPKLDQAPKSNIEENLKKQKNRVHEDLNKQKLPENDFVSKGKRVIYRDNDTVYDQTNKEPAKKKSAYGCCFFIFLILVALLSFLLAGFLVFRSRF